MPSIRYVDMKYTLSLLGLNILIFAAYVYTAPNALYTIHQLLAGTPVSYNELFPNIITYMFGHAGIAHCTMNMLMLCIVGRSMEGKAGLYIIPVYCMAGVVGAVAHMWYTDVPLIGASAAVSGLFGAAIAYRTVSAGSIVYYVMVLNVLPLFGVLSMIGFGDPGVSYVSHLGGVAAGVVAGVLLRYTTQPKKVGALLH